MIVTTRSGVTRRIVRMLATANRSTVARTRWWLKVFTFRRLREIAYVTNLVGPQPVSRIGWREINARQMGRYSAWTMP